MSGYELIKEINFNVLESIEVDLTQNQEQKKKRRRVDDYDYEDDFIEPFEGENELVDIECKLENFFVYKGEMKSSGKRIVSVYKNRIKKKDNGIKEVEEVEEKKFFRANVNDPLKIQIEAAVGFSLDNEEQKPKPRGGRRTRKGNYEEGKKTDACDRVVPDNSKIKLPRSAGSPSRRETIPIRPSLTDEINFLKTLLITRNPNLLAQRRGVHPPEKEGPRGPREVALPLESTKIPESIALIPPEYPNGCLSQARVDPSLQAERKSPQTLLNYLKASPKPAKPLSLNNGKSENEINVKKVDEDKTERHFEADNVESVFVDKSDIKDTSTVDGPSKPDSIVKPSKGADSNGTICLVNEILVSRKCPLETSQGNTKWMTASNRDVLRFYLQYKLKTMESNLDNKITQIFYFYFNLIANEVHDEQYIINFSLLEKFLPPKRGDTTGDYYSHINNLMEESDLSYFSTVLDSYLSNIIVHLKATVNNYEMYNDNGRSFAGFNSHSFMCNCIIFFYLSCCKEMHHGNNYHMAFDKAKLFIRGLFPGGTTTSGFLQKMNMKMKSLIKMGDFSI